MRLKVGARRMNRCKIIFMSKGILLENHAMRSDEAFRTGVASSVHLTCAAGLYPQQQQVIPSISGFVTCIAELFSIKYDGWSCVVQKASNLSLNLDRNQGLPLRVKGCGPLAQRSIVFCDSI